MITPSPFSTAFRFNDFAIQRYAPESQGIGIHRDGERYEHIVVIATLAGNSRLFATNSRDGRQRRIINDRPGRIVLLSAPFFAGRKGEWHDLYMGLITFMVDGCQRRIESLKTIFWTFACRSKFNKLPYARVSVGPKAILIIF